MVRARHLTPESIIKGIEARDYYASSGVILRHVGFSPQSRILGLEIEPQGKVNKYGTCTCGHARASHAYPQEQGARCCARVAHDARTIVACPCKGYAG